LGDWFRVQPIPVIAGHVSLGATFTRRRRSGGKVLSASDGRWVSN